MGIFRSLSGMVVLELLTADVPGAIAAMNGNNIPFFSARQKDEVTFVFSVSRRYVKILRKLFEKRGETLRQRELKGVYWQLGSLKRRPVLTVGVILLLLCMLYLPRHIFFVRVSGASAVPERKILEAAAECGIRFGASRREVRSERVKNALLEAVPQLQWAGVNTSGVVAVISVRERTDTRKPADTAFVTGITAVRDGIITNCTATGGNLLCSPGQAVKEGQLLISAYTDCGLTIRVSGAQGEVFARTMRHLTVCIPSEFILRSGESVESRNYSLLLGKKRINLWKDSGISDTTCGRIYSENYVTLPGGFQLPLGLAVETVSSFRLDSTEIPETDAQTLLASFAPRYLTGQMIAGDIRSRDETVSRKEGRYELAGEYVCTEMIGRVQREQIGEYHGEDR